MEGNNELNNTELEEKSNNSNDPEPKKGFWAKTKALLIKFWIVLKGFLERKNIKISLRVYFIDAMGAMALGLFASLLIGTILKTIGDLTGWQYFIDLAKFAQSGSGAAMAVAIGYALKCPPLVLFSLVAVGISANQLGGAGGPISVLLFAIVAAEFGKAVSKETKVDLIVTPLVTIMVGCSLSMLLAPWIGEGAKLIGQAINTATELQPFLMGVIISVAIGMCLTLPISSAAICASFGLVGLAGGAALAGCCCQMVGFAIMSFKENKWGGLVSQGIGTSMLQMPNIVKKPIIWLPTIISSAIVGPISTCLFKLEMNGPAISSGMGTCGLVGQIGVFNGWIEAINNGTKASITALDWTGLIMVSFILPAVITLIIHFIFIKLHAYKSEDLKLEL